MGNIYICCDNSKKSNQYLTDFKKIQENYLMNSYESEIKLNYNNPQSLFVHAKDLLNTPNFIKYWTQQLQEHEFNTNDINATIYSGIISQQECPILQVTFQLKNIFNCEMSNFQDYINYFMNYQQRQLWDPFIERLEIEEVVNKNIDIMTLCIKEFGAFQKRDSKVKHLEAKLNDDTQIFYISSIQRFFKRKRSMSYKKSYRYKKKGHSLRRTYTNQLNNQIEPKTKLQEIKELSNYNDDSRNSLDIKYSIILSEKKEDHIQLSYLFIGYPKSVYNCDSEYIQSFKYFLMERGQYLCRELNKQLKDNSHKFQQILKNYQNDDE